MRLAIDAMNGDFGPRVIVPAALLALQRQPTLYLKLFGDAELIQATLEAAIAKYQFNLSVYQRLQVCSSAGRLIAAAPATLLRDWLNNHEVTSSAHASLLAVANGEAQGCVSAADSGVLLVLAKHFFGLLPHIERPAIYTVMPTLHHGHSYLLDLGANVDCTSRQLVGFARLGAALAKLMDKSNKPRLALLNVGVESYKGNRLVRETDQLLRDLALINLDYIGFIEGDKIFAGIADVIICDGFTGNIVLKVSEGLMRNLLQSIELEWAAKQANLWETDDFAQSWQALQQRFDPIHYNGASFLGIQATVVKSHGSASIEAFTQAILHTMQEVTDCLPQRLSQLLNDDFL